MSCIFCKIINKEIPSSIVYEDDKVIAFLDLSQMTLGHTLVLPKNHYDNILDISEDDYLTVMSVVKRLASSITKAFNTDSCNIINNCNALAGQTISHFHVHIIPRYKDDGVVISSKDHTDKYDLEEIKNTILSNL